MSFAAVASSLSLEVTYPFLGCRVARQHWGWQEVCGREVYLPCGLVAAVRFAVCLASNEGHKLPALSATAAADLILLLISSSNCLCVCRCVRVCVQDCLMRRHALLPPPSPPVTSATVASAFSFTLSGNILEKEISNKNSSNSSNYKQNNNNNNM